MPHQDDEQQRSAVAKSGRMCVAGGVVEVEVRKFYSG